MLMFAKPDISEREIVELYSQCTDAPDELVHMEFIEPELRRKRVALVKKPGMAKEAWTLTRPHLTPPHPTSPRSSVSTVRAPCR